ncbi:hypothetical protein GP486_002160 [Trichoglossum hirsutum]|uniref:Uncharacterized protein n=1 Tax=Trichoglossum hirsutum TaxID=265104 RepID=A0A9P8LFR3_9PEZI|nr:hypothetical protein GP486_002160 [Trichoglossum hirsutum]
MSIDEEAAAACPPSPQTQATLSSTASPPNAVSQEAHSVAAQPPRFWSTLTITLTSQLQGWGIVLGTIAALTTIYYAIRGYYIAEWTALKDNYEWCENEVRLFNQTIPRCLEVLEQPLPPPPYMRNARRRWLNKTLEGRTYTAQHGELGRSGRVSNLLAQPDLGGLGTHAMLVSSMTIFVCIVILAGLARLYRSQIVSVLGRHQMRNLLPWNQTLPCEFY